MANSSPNLEWCDISQGTDMNWWVEAISDEIHWDLDSLSILDPKQVAHILDLIDPLRDYGFQSELLEAAFFTFRPDSITEEGKVHLVRSYDSVLDTDEKVFALPNLVDDEKGPYADFLDHVTRLRVKFLNDAIDFEQRLTIEELEETVREHQNNDLLEGHNTHVFKELSDILEYVPEGFENDIEEGEPNRASKSEVEDEFPDFEEEGVIEEDETMKWDDEDDRRDEDEDSFDKDSDEDEDTEEDEVESEKTSKSKKSR